MTVTRPSIQAEENLTSWCSLLRWRYLRMILCSEPIWNNWRRPSMTSTMREVQLDDFDDAVKEKSVVYLFLYSASQMGALVRFASISILFRTHHLSESPQIFLSCSPRHGPYLDINITLPQITFLPPLISRFISSPSRYQRQPPTCLHVRPPPFTHHSDWLSNLLAPWEPHPHCHWTHARYIPRCYESTTPALGGNRCGATWG